MIACPYHVSCIMIAWYMQLYISANTRGNRSWTLGWESPPMPWHLTFPWNLDINHEKWEWKEKNLQLSGSKPKWTDSPFFNSGRFHLKAYISILLYINKVRTSGDTRGSFWPQVLLMQLSIFCPYKLSSPVCLSLYCSLVSCTWTTLLP